MRITLKRLNFDNYEIYVISNKGKFINRLGNIVVTNSQEYLRVDFELFRKYISLGAQLSLTLQKRIKYLSFLV